LHRDGWNEKKLGSERLAQGSAEEFASTGPAQYLLMLSRSEQRVANQL
jgi:hypothetical protein